LRNDKIIVLFTPAFVTSGVDIYKYLVCKATITPTDAGTNLTASHVDKIEYYLSDFCISNYRMSSRGTNSTTAPGLPSGNDTNFPRARAVAGFIDYNSTENDYYVPYTWWRDGSTNTRSVVSRATGTTYEPGTNIKLGLKCNFETGSGSNPGRVLPVDLYVQAYPCSGNGNIAISSNSDSQPYTIALGNYNGNEYSAFSTCCVLNPYKYLNWAYTLPARLNDPCSILSENPVLRMPPIQFVPLSGNGIHTNSMTEILPSQVMCGLELDEPIEKEEGQVLYLQYGWRIGQIPKS
jgi:hypothetical protein